MTLCSLRPMKRLTLLPVVLFAGCSLAPTYERPDAPIATTYGPDSPAVSASASGAVDIAWTSFFGDARMQALIELALANNRDLQVAALRIERVRALYNIQRTALIPTLNAGVDGTRQLTPGDINGTGSPRTVSTYGVAAEIPSYELDFFGRVTSLRDQVLQQYLATEEAARSAQIALVSAVARQHLVLLALEEQSAIAEANLATVAQAYALNQQAYDAGQASELDLRTAEGQRETVRAALATLHQQREQARNALTLLIGGPLPADLPPPGSLASADLLAELPVGMPADLLTRRPDVRAAEHQLQAANANIGIARAAFFPSVKLTAEGGTASTEFDNLFESGTGAWRFAPSITVPIFAAGANRARLEVAAVEKRIEVANYQKAIQTAFREVADALAARRWTDEQIAAQAARVAAAEKRHTLTQKRFEAGIDSYLPVLLAQQEQFSAQQALVQARLDQLTQRTNLFAALGGGWTAQTSAFNENS